MTGWFLLGIGIVVVIAWIISSSISIIIKLLGNAIVGYLLLWLINLLGNYLGFGVPITPWTAILAGITGLPGVVIMVIYYYIIKGGL